VKGLPYTWSQLMGSSSVEWPSMSKAGCRETEFGLRLALGAEPLTPEARLC